MSATIDLPADLHRDHDAVALTKVIGHRQVTDAYLAGSAQHHGARLATLDQGLAALHGDVADLLPAPAGEG